MPPSPWAQRSVLQQAALGLATFGGCTSLPIQRSQPTSSPTVTDTQSAESSSPTPIVIEGVEVPPCPTKPNELTRENVQAYASQFEQSYVTRVTIREQTADVDSIDVRIERGEVERDYTGAEKGWLVHLSAIGPYIQYHISPDSDEPDHVDPGVYTASYFVSEQTVMRAQSVEAIDPREEGTIVHCPPA